MSCLDQLSVDQKKSLLSSVFTKNYFFWIGSGFSYNFGYPSWGNVLNEVAEKIKYPMPLNVDQPLRAAELLLNYSTSESEIKESDFNALVAKSITNLKTEVKEPKWLKRFKHFAPNVIVTTNWDEVLEEVFDYTPNKIVRKDPQPKVSNNGRNIFKIHGDVGRPESIVVTQSQYFCFQREDTYLSRKIYTLFSEMSPIFIGYSLTDPNISFLYEEALAHLHGNNPPAFMVIHPNVDETIFNETKYLFKTKNIHLIKATIEDFFYELAQSFKEFKNTPVSFSLEHKVVIDKLTSLLNNILSGKKNDYDKIKETFPKGDSSHALVKAIVQLMKNPVLYTHFGGKLLSPDNIIPYREFDSLVGIIITLCNEHNYPDEYTRTCFHEVVVSMGTETSGVWDFNYAATPFENILRIHPKKGTEVFTRKIEHIINIMRWSAPSEIGKCWATWNVFVSKVNWINDEELGSIIDKLENDANFAYQEKDNKWLEVLKKRSEIKKRMKLRIDALIS
ncbi:TPA: SIR2 family protein [Enterobacter hormaechei subsp. steigerwaltii]|nr:SIR2 family protein [Enterobacter hormaechei subsp. steigerwaltii]